MTTEKLKALLLYKGYSISESDNPLLVHGEGKEYLKQFESEITISDVPQPVTYKSLSRNQKWVVKLMNERDE